MGRANVYLPDDLERRVKAARVPISEVCQRALLAAVEAAEGVGGRLQQAAGGQFAHGFAAGTAWTSTAGVDELLTALRDDGLPEVPPDALASDFYTLTRSQSLAWEAGFMQAVRAAVGSALTTTAAPADTDDADPDTVTVTGDDGVESDSADDPGPGRLDLTKNPRSDAPRLGDDSGCRIGTTVDDIEVSFDPHSAVRAGRSPLFAILGPAEHRARFSLSVAQDAASRGAAVVVVDLSGSVAPRATGLGRNVRVTGRAPSPARPLEELLRGSLGGGAAGLGGLWDMMSSFGGSGLGELLTPPQTDLLEPGYVSVLPLSVDGGLSAALALGQAAHSLTRLGAATEFPGCCSSTCRPVSPSRLPSDPGSGSSSAPRASRTRPSASARRRPTPSRTWAAAARCCPPCSRSPPAARSRRPGYVRCSATMRRSC